MRNLTTGTISAILFYSIVCCVGLVSYAGAKCTDHTSPGLPSCNFDQGFCGSFISDPLNYTHGVNWKWGNETRIGSRVFIERDWQPSKTQGKMGNFVYLDVANGSAIVGSVARMNGFISDTTVKAVCIEFHYATFSDGHNVPSIKVYNLLQNGTELLIGKVQFDSQGQWKVATVHSCIGKRSTISFESEKLSNTSVVALDYIAITESTLRCEDFETTLITTQIPTTSLTSATTSEQITTPNTTAQPIRATGPEVSMVIHPENSTETIDTNVKIACNLGYSDKYKEIYVVMIVNGSNQQVAMMRIMSKITLNDDVGNRFDVDGFLDNNNVKASYLELTLKAPKFEDSGKYSCIVSYLNQEGLLAQDETSASLVVRKLDFSNNDKLETVMYSLINRLEKLEAINKHQTETISNLQTRMDYRSSFNAYPSQKNNHRRPLGPNMVIIFDKVTSKQGQGYNARTGVYTAPVSGLYAFHLTVGTWSKSSNSYSEVVISVNNVPTSLLRTNNDRNIGGGNQDQNSMSLVVPLNPGDTVKVVTVAGTATNEEIYDYLSTFSGYLIRPY